MNIGMKIGNINNLKDDQKVIDYFKHKEIVGNTNFIDEYTHSSKSINKNLWQNKEHAIDDDVIGINKELNQSPNFHHNFTIYSGIRKNPDEITNNNLLHHPAFMSASISPKTALDFAEYGTRHILKIHVKKHQNIGAYIGDKSQYPDQHEFIIKPNQLLYISPNYTEHKYNTRENVRIHDAHILEPHEYEHLLDNPEVQKHIEMSKYLPPSNSINHKFINDNINGTKENKLLIACKQNLLPKHVESLLSNNDPDITKALINNPYHVLTKKHIDKLSDNYHNELKNYPDYIQNSLHENYNTFSYFLIKSYL